MIPLPLFRQVPCEEGVRFHFTLPADHPAFQGHFPSWPVLPGVIQVDWAIRMGELAFGPLGPFAGLRTLKFQKIIQPDQACILTLVWKTAPTTLRFIYTHEGQTQSSGVILFESLHDPLSPCKLSP